MPRTGRKKSASGIYHVMLRGINQQQIFEDDEDFDRFLGILRECKRICGFELYAYCLMGNHVHLLMREGKEPLELIFKRLGSRFGKNTENTEGRFYVFDAPSLLLAQSSGRHNGHPERQRRGPAYLEKTARRTDRAK